MSVRKFKNEKFEFVCYPRLLNIQMNTFGFVLVHHIYVSLFNYCCSWKIPHQGHTSLPFMFTFHHFSKSSFLHRSMQSNFNLFSSFYWRLKCHFYLKMMLFWASFRSAFSLQIRLLGFQFVRIRTILQAGLKSSV